MQSTIDTDAFYRESCERRFVKVDDIARNIGWTTDTEYGALEITINLSKPEKDPRAIAAAASAAPANKAYVDPATGRQRPCPLCVSQADIDCGYAKPLQLNGEPWALWYSPYAYYEQHCIAMSWEHRPMHIDRKAFSALFDVVDVLPQYFFGSNADLPIVGGSILSHDHFQGGKHTFAMELAPVVDTFDLPGFPEVSAGIVKWPLSVIRLRSASRTAVIDAACVVLETWRTYDDLKVGIVSGLGDDAASIGASSGLEGAAKEQMLKIGALGSGPVKKVHNTVTPILRYSGGQYELDLALRCNITSKQHPLGTFHPHEELHHIKKENIGLIEVMGLAILPPRVKQVMQERGLSRDDVGRSFAQVLEHAGVFKWDDAGRAALARFLERVQAQARAL